MKFTVLFSILLFTQNVFAISIEEKKQANIYADFLIEEFDKELDKDYKILDIKKSEVYNKIVAARIFLEQSESIHKSHKHESIKRYERRGIMEIPHVDSYLVTVKKIDEIASRIYAQNLARDYQNKSFSGVLYPSTDGKGNLTGNTYPKNVWTLTFDDGPRGARTKTVVDNLYRYNMKGSFFMLTREAKKYQSTVDYVKDADMEIALHSYTHKDLNKADDKTMDYELKTAKKELEKLAGVKIKHFRLPYGSGTRNKKLRQKIADLGMMHIFWNVDTLDWKDKNPESIFQRTIKQMNKTPKKSGIILFHDIHAQTVIASEMVMKYLDENNKTVCTLKDVISYHNGQKQDCL